MRSTHILKYDTNSDGLVTQAEAQKATGQKINFKAFDLNKDGSLTLQEITDAPTPLFSRLDRNSDRRLNKQEMDLALKFMKAN